MTDGLEEDRICITCGEMKSPERFRQNGRYRYKQCLDCSNAAARANGPKKRRELIERKPLYNTWVGMKQRTENPNKDGYYLYGGRGITVCEDWRDSYQAFEDYMGERPSPQHSIDRINNDGNYEPGNVRWSTVTEQQNNRRCSALLTYRGKIQTLPEWAREAKMSRKTLQSRLRMGWSIERALTEPVLPRTVSLDQ